MSIILDNMVQLTNIFITDYTLRAQIVVQTRVREKCSFAALLN